MDPWMYVVRVLLYKNLHKKQQKGKEGNFCSYFCFFS